MSVPPRTTVQKVVKVLGDDYGPLDDGTLPDLNPFVEAASNLVDQVISLAASRVGYGSMFANMSPLNSLTTAQAELVERWLAAHFYQQPDPGYQSRSTAGASGQFTGQTAMNLENTRYGQQAMVLDTTGGLRILSKRQIAGAVWLGKPPSQQINYRDRS